MKTILSVLIALAVLAMGSMVSAHHQTAGGVTILHTSLDEDVPGYGGSDDTFATTNLNYQGNMFPSEAKTLLETATEGSAVILDIRSPWERNGSPGGCLTQVAVGLYIDPLNAGIPYWNSPTKNNSIPVHLQGPIGIAFNAQASDGTDLVGWPFRSIGHVIMNPDFDNYLKALDAEGLMKKDTAVIVMCASGWRSKYMADYLNEKGYTKVYNMRGGLAAWNDAGYPVSTSETDWQTWDNSKLYDPARLAPYGGAQWPNSVFLKGGDPVIPEWMGDYVPSNSMVGYQDPSCTAPSLPTPSGGLANVGLNGPWPRDKAIDDLSIVPTLTSITSPAGWAGPTLNMMCIQTMMGFHGMSYGDAVLACAGAPAVVPGYFNAWPIKKGNFIEGASLPIRGVRDDPCGDMFTGFFGTGWYPLQSYCEQRFLQNQMRTCSNPLDCVGSRDYCWAMPPFGSGFAPVASPDGKFWTPDLIWSVDFHFAMERADLYVSTVSAPGSASPGSTITVGATVNKSGSGTAPTSTARIYLYGNLTGTGNKFMKLGDVSVSSFGAGSGSDAVSASVTIPSWVVPGSHSIIVRADLNDVVSEWNESNNRRTKPVTIVP